MISFLYLANKVPVLPTFPSPNAAHVSQCHNLLGEGKSDTVGPEARELPLLPKHETTLIRRGQIWDKYLPKSKSTMFLFQADGITEDLGREEVTI